MYVLILNSLSWVRVWKGCLKIPLIEISVLIVASISMGQVQNKLDGCCYAVKRIHINPTSKQFRRIKGEVTLLSRLNHENIVRYYNAWIEKHVRPLLSCPAAEIAEEKKVADKQALNGKDKEESVDEVEANAPPPVLTSSVEWSTSCEKSSSTRFSAADQESSDEDEDDDDDEGEGVFSQSFL